MVPENLIPRDKQKYPRNDSDLLKNSSGGIGETPAKQAVASPLLADFTALPTLV